MTCLSSPSQISEVAVRETVVPDTYDFVLEEHLQEAKQILDDERVTNMRYELVPSELSEAEFWR